MSIRAVIFDLGGVLMRTENRAPRAQLAARLGMTYEQLSALIFDSHTSWQAQLGQITVQAHWEALATQLGMTPAEFSVVRGEFWAGDVLDMQLVDYLRSLRPRYKTGLLSNAWDDLRGVLQQEWHIADAFDGMIISAEVGVAKPDPHIYRLALERLGVKPAEAVFVDDFLQNVEGARAVGMYAIQFRSPEQARTELEQLLNGR